MARQGYVYICVDLQHGLIDYQMALGMLQAISQTPTIPFARVPSNDFGAINKILDAGVLGVIVPMVNSPEEARAVVDACRYNPEGSRSFGPTRAGYSAGPNYFSSANAEVACVPMIETRQAVERVDEILSVARQTIAKACAAHGVTAGIHASASLAAKHIEAGYRMITVSSDTGSLASGAARDLRRARG